MRFSIKIILPLLVSLASLHAEIVVEGELTRNVAAKPGDMYSDSITISNIGIASESVRIYVKDYLFYADGRIEYPDPGTHPRSNGEWITYNPREVVVEPNQSFDIRYRVAVPAGTELKGSYWSILMIETIPAPAEGAQETKEDTVEVGLQQIFRYGLQIITDIRDTAFIRIEFEDTRLQKTDEKIQLLYDIVNTGDSWVRSTSWLELYDPQGVYLETLETSPRRIYPGTSVRFTHDLSAYIDAELVALAIVDCGGSNIFGANLRLKLDE